MRLSKCNTRSAAVMVWGATFGVAMLALVGAPAEAARLSPPPGTGVRMSAPPPVALRSSEPGRGRPGYVGFSVRVGGGMVALRARDLPMAGDDLAAFARVTGTDVSEVDFRERLAIVAPSLHVGGSGYFFRMDAPIGFSNRTKTYGLGIYPLNVGVSIPRARLMPYASGGGVASFVTADSAGGGLATGGLFQVRTAIGVKLLPGRRTDLSLELGYSPWAAGGVLSPGELEKARQTVERGARVEQPSRALRVGAGDIWDLSLGVGWL